MCGTAVFAPEGDDDFASEGDPPRKPVKATSAGMPAPVEGADDEDGRPRKELRRRDDDDRNRPRKLKAGSKKMRGVPVWLLVVGGVGTLAVGGVIAAAFLFVAKVNGPGGLLGPSTPPGYTAVRETAGGCAVFLPGDAKKVKATINGQDASELGHYGWSAGGGPFRGDDKQTTAWTRPLTAGFNPGTDPEALYQLAINADWSLAFNSETREVVGKRPITLGGKPGLELKIKAKPRLWSRPGDNGFWKEKDREETERVAKEGLYTVYYITHNGKQSFIISISQRNEFPPDDVLKIVSDSFTLL